MLDVEEKILIQITVGSCFRVWKAEVSLLVCFGENKRVSVKRVKIGVWNIKSITETVWKIGLRKRQFTTWRSCSQKQIKYQEERVAKSFIGIVFLNWCELHQQVFRIALSDNLCCFFFRTGSELWVWTEILQQSFICKCRNAWIFMECQRR